VRKSIACGRTGGEINCRVGNGDRGWEGRQWTRKEGLETESVDSLARLPSLIYAVGRESAFAKGLNNNLKSLSKGLCPCVKRDLLCNHGRAADT
jgi:hypothetical protein